MQTLTSARNPALKELRKTIARGGLTDQGYCVAEGFHLLEEGLASGCEIHAVFTNDAAAERVKERLRGEDSPQLMILADALFQTVATTEATQGVIALIRPPHWTIADLFGRRSPLLVLDGIQDPGNAGTMIRAAEAFGASGVLLLKGSVCPFNSKALRASSGSVFRMPLVTGVEREQFLTEVEHRGLQLFALMPAGQVTLEDCRLDCECAVVVGSEGQGVTEQLARQTMGVRIPTLGVESLNAAMAATVLLYEAHRQRRASSQ